MGRNRHKNRDDCWAVEIFRTYSESGFGFRLERLTDQPASRPLDVTIDLYHNEEVLAVSCGPAYACYTLDVVKGNYKGLGGEHDAGVGRENDDEIMERDNGHAGDR